LAFKRPSSVARHDFLVTFICSISFERGVELGPSSMAVGDGLFCWFRR